LKATEYKDAILVTESGLQVDCFRVCWMIATTDAGLLFDAFRTRFSNVDLKYLSKDEISKVVKLNNPDWSTEVCDLVAHYNTRIPRKALEFARFMRLVHNMQPRPWSEIAAEVAENEGIDEHGMHETHLAILRALGQNPISQKRICNVVNRKLEEVERFIMPWLLSSTDDQPAYVKVTSRGYAITDAGAAELKKRGVPFRPTALESNYV
jgi:Holliday junction resolvasome RuvABC ATP-dependent DNA helicase subunit